MAILSVSLTAGALASTALGSGMQHAPAAEAAPPKSTDQTVPRYLGAIPDSKSANRVSRSVTRNDQPDQVLSLQLKPVEQGIADRGPLDGGLRSIDLGLQLPSGYRQCFERPGGGFMRADGGLVAMFHQSIYVQTREGLLPDIPASTIFVIGGVPLAAEIGHGRLLPVDPLDPGRGPSAAEVFAPRVAPDEAWVVSATPGDRIRRFGYGPGYRVAASARPDPVVEVEHHLVEPRDAGESIALRAGDSNRNTSRLQSRFFEDSSYRRDRMRSLAASCTESLAPRRLRSSEPSTTEASESDRSRSAPAQHPKP